LVGLEPTTIQIAGMNINPIPNTLDYCADSSRVKPWIT